jgi:periplasmic protein TonB
VQITSNQPDSNQAIVPATAGVEQQQRRRMLIALALLVVALVVVFVKSRQVVAPEAAPAASETRAATSEPVQPEPVTPVPAAVAAPKKTTVASKTVILPKESSVPPTTVSRAVLPPLEVEVIAGDQRMPLQPPKPETVKVDTSQGVQGRVSRGTVAAEVAAGSPDVAKPASERVRLSPQAQQVLSKPVVPSYPLLAREMKVQGSVILDAVIGRDGTIQDLHVVSGPAILASAALEAVRQWHFKPYLQSGQAVETEARITVNFTISTS